MTETECPFPGSPSTSHVGDNLSLELLFKFMGLILIILEEEKNDEKSAQARSKLLNKVLSSKLGLNIFPPPTPSLVVQQEIKTLYK